MPMALFWPIGTTCAHGQRVFCYFTTTVLKNSVPVGLGT